MDILTFTTVKKKKKINTLVLYKIINDRLRFEEESSEFRDFFYFKIVMVNDNAV